MLFSDSVCGGQICSLLGNNGSLLISLIRFTQGEAWCGNHNGIPGKSFSLIQLFSLDFDIFHSDPITFVYYLLYNTLHSEGKLASKHSSHSAIISIQKKDPPKSLCIPHLCTCYVSSLAVWRQKKPSWSGTLVLPERAWATKAGVEVPVVNTFEICPAAAAAAATISPFLFSLFDIWYS